MHPRTTRSCPPHSPISIFPFWPHAPPGACSVKQTRGRKGEPSSLPNSQKARLAGHTLREAGDPKSNPVAQSCRRWSLERTCAAPYRTLWPGALPAPGSCPNAAACPLQMHLASSGTGGKAWGWVSRSWVQQRAAGAALQRESLGVAVYVFVLFEVVINPVPGSGADLHSVQRSDQGACLYGKETWKANCPRSSDSSSGWIHTSHGLLQARTAFAGLFGLFLLRLWIFQNCRQPAEYMAGSVLFFGLWETAWENIS